MTSDVTEMASRVCRHDGTDVMRARRARVAVTVRDPSPAGPMRQGSSTTTASSGWLETSGADAEISGDGDLLSADIPGVVLAPAAPGRRLASADRACSPTVGAVAIDLRSDTVTRPTPGMLAAMASAETGDDVYAEDPTVRVLEERVASMLGHEAGLFTVTGSLANMLGIRTWVGPGQELLCEAQAHVVRAELGGHAAWHGVTTRTWSDPRGHVDLDAVGSMLAPDAGPYLVSSAAVAVENTHNFAGGTVQPLADLRALRDLVDGTGVRLHLDGATTVECTRRIRDALAVFGGAVRHRVRLPVERARRTDRLSSRRPSGVDRPGPAVAQADGSRLAAGRRARGGRQLRARPSRRTARRRPRERQDHRRATRRAPGWSIPTAVETNIVMLDLNAARLGASELVETVRAEGVLAAAIGPRTVRLITHLDVTADDCRKAAETLARLLDA